MLKKLTLFLGVYQTIVKKSYFQVYVYKKINKTGKLNYVIDVFYKNFKICSE